MSSSYDGPTKLELFALISRYNHSHPQNTIEVLNVTEVEKGTVRCINTAQDRATAGWTPLQKLAKKVVIRLEDIFNLQNQSISHPEDEKMGAAAGKISEFWELAGRIGNHKQDDDRMRSGGHGEEKNHKKRSLKQRYASPERQHHKPQGRRAPSLDRNLKQPEKQTSPFSAIFQRKADEMRANAKQKDQFEKVREVREAQELRGALNREHEHKPAKGKAERKERDSKSHKSHETNYNSQEQRDSLHVLRTGSSHQGSREQLGHGLKVSGSWLEKSGSRTPSPQPRRTVELAVEVNQAYHPRFETLNASHTHKLDLVDHSHGPTYPKPTPHHGQGLHKTHKDLQSSTLQQENQERHKKQRYSNSNYRQNGAKESLNSHSRPGPLVHGGHDTHRDFNPHHKHSADQPPPATSIPRIHVQTQRRPVVPPAKISNITKQRSIEDIKATERARRKYKPALAPVSHSRYETPEDHEKKKKHEKYLVQARLEAEMAKGEQPRNGEQLDEHVEQKQVEVRVNALAMQSEVRRDNDEPYDAPKG